MKPKAFLQYYLITLLVSLGAAAIPLWHFAVMIHCYLQRETFLRFDQYRAVIPFAAVAVAILITFVLLPLVKNISLRKKHIFSSIFAVFIFCGVESIGERIASHLYILGIVLTSRAPFYYNDSLLADPFKQWTVFPIAVRLHYYIFSIIFILAVINLLYKISQNLFEGKKPISRPVILNGIATACYAIIYLFISVIQYNNYATMQITPGSVLNVAICFTLASVAFGLFSVSFIRFAGWKKIIPSVTAVLTVLALYGAEFAMLGGKFYSYGENSIVNLLIHASIIIVPAVIVQILPRYIYKLR